jgi:hypothetical protein
MIRLAAIVASGDPLLIVKELLPSLTLIRSKRSVVWID